MRVCVYIYIYIYDICIAPSRVKLPRLRAAERAPALAAGGG